MDECQWNETMQRLFRDLEASAKRLNALDPHGHFRAWLNDYKRTQHGQTKLPRRNHRSSNRSSLH